MSTFDKPGMKKALNEPEFVISDRRHFIGAGEHGYHTHRIPALATSCGGATLLFWEGRCGSSSDFGQIYLLVSRSEDNGRSWSPPNIVYREGDADDTVAIGNPVPIVDAETKAVTLLFTRNNERVFATRSQDDGRSWGNPREITEQVCPAHWLRYWTGPGHGIQLRFGVHAGRLLAPCYHLEPSGAGGPDIGYSHAIYSDDHGQTWHVGGTVLRGEGIEEKAIVHRYRWWPNGIVWSGSEALCAELHDGEIYMLIRDQAACHKRKIVARSTDGGQRWRPMGLQSDLPCFTCQSGLLRTPEAFTPTGVADRLLTTGIGESTEAGGRRNLTLWISNDGGRSWSKTQLLQAGPCGYSDLCALPGGRILCVYEAGDNTYRDRLEMRVLVPLNETESMECDQ